MFSFSRSSDAPTRWTLLSYAYASVVAAAVGWFLMGVPIQLTDSYGNLLNLRDGTLWDVVYNQLYQSAYLRPLLWGHLRVVYDLADGNYYTWFRGWHVAQVTLLVILFVRVIRPRTADDAAVVPLGLAALVGIHTFAGTVREAFPINTFMTILLCCLAAADLALGERRWWRAPAAWLLFLFAAFTVETGLLVAVVFVAAFAAGARGVSARGLAGVLMLLAGYFWVRFGFLDVGAPDLMERSSGFGFGTLSPEELTARFGGNPMRFYTYNVLASLASLLFSEPRGGVFMATDRLMQGEPRVPDIVNVIASTLGTALILGYAWYRRRAWLARDFSRGDQLVIMAVLVAGANATMAYAYTKDVIMSPAGAFYALALAAAARHLLAAQVAKPAWRSVTAIALLLVVSGAWAWRAVGMHVGVRHAAVITRDEWAYAEGWLANQNISLAAPDDLRLKEQLQWDAIVRPKPSLRGDWVEWFDE